MSFLCQSHEKRKKNLWAIHGYHRSPIGLFSAWRFQAGHLYVSSLHDLLWLASPQLLLGKTLLCKDKTVWDDHIDPKDNLPREEFYISVRGLDNTRFPWFKCPKVSEKRRRGCTGFQKHRNWFMMMCYKNGGVEDPAATKLGYCQARLGSKLRSHYQSQICS